MPLQITMWHFDLMTM